MNAQEFTYWLQGFFEVENPATLNEEQTRKIKEKLETCFVNVTNPVRTGYCQPWDGKIALLNDQNIEHEIDFKTKYTLNDSDLIC